MRYGLYTVLVCVLLWVFGLPTSARADSSDSIDQLTATLTSSLRQKERMSAAVALGRLADRRATQALIRALQTDEHRSVRGLAAIALGRIGDEAALPALEKALEDPDKRVRRRARAAIAAIKKQLAQKPQPQPQPQFKVSTGTGDPGFGQAPKAVQRPALYIVLKSTSDKSSDRASSKTRKRRAEAMKQSFAKALLASPEVTTNLKVAEKFRITPYHLDASITEFRRQVNATDIEIECKIRVTISDERGKMLSFLTGGAKLQAPKTSTDTRYLQEISEQAIESAVNGMQQDLLKYLRRLSPS